MYRTKGSGRWWLCWYISTQLEEWDGVLRVIEWVLTAYGSGVMWRRRRQTFLPTVPEHFTSPTFLLRNPSTASCAVLRDEGIWPVDAWGSKSYFREGKIFARQVAISQPPKPQMIGNLLRWSRLTCRTSEYMSLSGATSHEETVF